MRIISGIAGRRRINVPKSVARPSTDRLREALFSILGSRVDGARVLDLFAGSGALGMECLSRGAVACDFVDESRESIKMVRDNLQSLALKGGRVVESDVFRFLRGRNGPYDLVFADPPYFKHLGDVDFVNDLLSQESLPSMLADDALLVVEDPPRNERLSEIVHGDEVVWSLLDQRKYGSCGILFYQRA